ncbi:MAG: DMT family transporter [Proteobacteria bacterium]|nr:DMT family transporter [Pseudomonadota bacterium]
MSVGSPQLRAIVYTSITMLAFAGNSILCRMALRDGAIDPASFTSIRLLSGALALLLIVRLTSNKSSVREHGSWTSALVLFIYAVCFSYAYISLSVGAGALILFGFVQGTMIAMALWSGDRPNVSEWLGWLLAFGGLVWLLIPGIEAPPAAGASLMALAGIAWGVYSIRGRNQTNALLSTCSNFVYSIAFVIVLTAITVASADLTGRGILLAIISGAITSGVGYVIWYAALKYLRTMQAALVQLSVPAIAAAGGVILLAEPVSLRLLASGALILGGISLALVQKSHRAADS